MLQRARGHGWGPHPGVPPQLREQKRRETPPAPPLTCHSPAGWGRGRGDAAGARGLLRAGAAGASGRERLHEGGPGASPPHTPAPPRPHQAGGDLEAALAAVVGRIFLAGHSHSRRILIVRASRAPPPPTPPLCGCPNADPPSPQFGDAQCERERGGRTCCAPPNPQSLAAECPRNCPPQRRRPLPTDQCQPGASPAAPRPREPGDSQQRGVPLCRGVPGGVPATWGSPQCCAAPGAGGGPQKPEGPLCPPRCRSGPRGLTHLRERGRDPQRQWVPRNRGASPTQGVPEAWYPPPPPAPRCTHLRADPHLHSPRVPPAVTMARGGHVPGLRGARVAGGSGEAWGGLRYVPSAAPARGGAVRSGAVRRRDPSPTRSRALPRTAAIVCG